MPRSKPRECFHYRHTYQHYNRHDMTSEDYSFRSSTFTFGLFTGISPMSTFGYPPIDARFPLPNRQRTHTHSKGSTRLQICFGHRRLDAVKTSASELPRLFGCLPGKCGLPWRSAERDSARLALFGAQSLQAKGQSPANNALSDA